MRNRKHGAADIVEALQMMDRGESAHVVCAQWKISLSTLYEWRNLYRGMPFEAVSRLEDLRRENAVMRQRLNRYEKDRDILMVILQHQNLDVSTRCSMVTWLIQHYHIGVSRACELTGISRTLFLSRSQPEKLETGE
ncbi:hypothetical protein FPJ27_15695 [Burkholderia sp. MS455]|uniref:transposase n=1 Tax=Burkholderia sp. MS455 TaxID=2811788 RepID=UPI001959FEBF|nr:transposase [Burkholderia sp. MS455]QRR07695.1 hypothetical protein FPJ27_15695 [Burkholderia sp. MS455]